MSDTKLPRRYDIVAGWLISGDGSPIQKNMRIRIRNRMIQDLRPFDARQAVAESSEFSSAVLDFSGCTLIPGLMDAHLHLFMSGTSDPVIRDKQLAATYEEICPVIRRHLQNLHDYGIVAVRDGGDYGGYALRFQRESGPEASPVAVRSSGKAWRMPGRYGKLIGRPPDSEQSLSDAILEVFRRKPVDHVKIVQSGINSLKEFGRQTPPQFPVFELKAGIETAHRLGLKVMIHCNGPIPVKQALDAGCDSVEHGFFMGPENLDLMARNGTVWVPTAITMKALAQCLPPGGREADMARRNYDHQVDQIASARKKGVKVAVGTDAGSLGVHHGSSVCREMEILTEAGYSLAEAVMCAASRGASLLGMEDTGLIAPGMRDAVIAVEGPPDRLLSALAEPSRIRWIPAYKP